MVLFWTLRPGEGATSLTLKERQPDVLEPGQVRVALKAWSMNARDAMVAMGQSPVPVAEELTPLSDAAGIVEEIGAGVTRVKVGDRVVVTFNPAHQSGAFEPWMAAHAFGENPASAQPKRRDRSIWEDQLSTESCSDNRQPTIMWRA